MEPILHDKFKKKFKKLSSKIREKFYTRISIFKENPFADILHNHSVDERFSGCRSINITGDYRAIYRFENDKVIFVNIGTHSQLYG